MKSKFFLETSREYVEFLTTEPITPPAGLSKWILSRVRAGLTPSAWKVFGKLSMVHFFVGLVTLAICPQFGFRVFGDGVGLMSYFQALGHYGCMIACGAFFLGLSIAVASIVLRPEEVRVLRRTELLQIAAMISLSLGVFIMAGAEIVVGFGLAWVAGSFLGGIAAIELVWAYRKAHV
jgi:hypothetical protein